MDRLQYVYSSSETSDEELESADTALSPKERTTTVGSSKKTADILAYTPARPSSQSPSETRSSSEKRHSPDSTTGRYASRGSPESRGRSAESRGRSLDSRKDRRSPPYRRRSKERKRSRDKGRDRDRDRDRRRHRSQDRSKDRRRDRSRGHRYDRRSRSRSPRRSHSRRDSPKRSKDRSRSPPPRKHFDPKNKLFLLNRMGIDYKGTEIVDMPNKQPAGGGTSSSSANNPALPQYYNPQTINAGKYAEQIAKRKMLWNSKKVEKPEADPSNIWQGAKFSQDQDGKMTAKFQRLMGMKDGAPPGSGKGQELIKKQEELFSTMEMQYEVARATTHTQRGVGLGFGPRHIP